MLVGFRKGFQGKPEKKSEPVGKKSSVGVMQMLRYQSNRNPHFHSEAEGGSSKELQEAENGSTMTAEI